MGRFDNLVGFGTLRLMKYIYFFPIFIIAILSVFGIVLAEDTYEYTQGYRGAYDISKGKGVIIAVIDTGVWRDHPDFGQSMWINPKEIPGNKLDDDKNGYIDDYSGWNFVDKSANITPKNEHGTNVAGIIIGQPSNGIGVAGIAPEAKIMPLIACDAKECPKQAIIDAIKYAVDNKAKIINLSLGANGSVAYSADYNKMIKYAYDRGVLVVASVGNGDVKSIKQVGKDLNVAKVSPVCNDTVDVNMVVGVGSVKKDSFTKTTWTNYNDKYVDVWVRGESITTATMPSFAKGLNYITISGTSFSAPIVSGAAALLIATNPKLKVYQVISMLKNTTPFNVNTLLTNTVYTSSCMIKYFSKEVKNGEAVVLDASNLKPDITLQLKNSENNQSFTIISKNLIIVDYNKLKIDTSKLSIPAGTYLVSSSSCNAEGKLLIKGEIKKPVIKPVCDVKNMINCNAAQLIELISTLLKNKK